MYIAGGKSSSPLSALLALPAAARRLCRRLGLDHFQHLRLQARFCSEVATTAGQQRMWRRMHPPSSGTDGPGGMGCRARVPCAAQQTARLGQAKPHRMRSRPTCQGGHPGALLVRQPVPRPLHFRQLGGPLAGVPQQQVRHAACRANGGRQARQIRHMKVDCSKSACARGGRELGAHQDSPDQPPWSCASRRHTCASPGPPMHSAISCRSSSECLPVVCTVTEGGHD